MAYRRTTDVQQRLDNQRNAIVDAANRLLAESGYAGCSIAAVAARAEVAVGTVYKHFPGKTELAVELFRNMVCREVAAVERASRHSAAATEQVVAVIETFALRALKSPRRAFALLAEPVDPGVESERLVFRAVFRDVIAARIHEGVASGTLPPQDAQLTAAALVGAAAEVLIGPLTATTADRDAVAVLRAFTLRALGGTDVHS